ncbi:MAG TPA: hypothetical protein PKH07_18735, partial [bacterium]|nr:hypothetical protein [bacterium]
MRNSDETSHPPCQDMELAKIANELLGDHCNVPSDSSSQHAESARFDIEKSVGSVSTNHPDISNPYAQVRTVRRDIERPRVGCVKAEQLTDYHAACVFRLAGVGPQASGSDTGPDPVCNPAFLARFLCSSHISNPIELRYVFFPRTKESPQRQLSTYLITHVLDGLQEELPVRMNATVSTMASLLSTTRSGYDFEPVTDKVLYDHGLTPFPIQHIAEFLRHEELIGVKGGGTRYCALPFFFARGGIGHLADLLVSHTHPLLLSMQIWTRHISEQTLEYLRDSIVLVEGSDEDASLRFESNLMGGSSLDTSPQPVQQHLAAESYRALGFGRRLYISRIL